MTVKLLAARGDYKAGNLFTSDANTEAALVTAKEATSDLTGGTTYVPSRNPQEPVNFNPSDIAALDALLLTPGNLATPLLVASFGADSSVNSDNTAADNAGRVVPGYSFVIPAGTMGPNGRLRWRWIGQNANGATVLQDGQIYLRIGAVRIAPLLTFAQVVSPSTRTAENTGTWENRNGVALNRFYDSNSKSAATLNLGTVDTTINTAVDQTVDVIGAWAGATLGSVITLRSLSAWIEYGA